MFTMFSNLLNKQIVHLPVPGSLRGTRDTKMNKVTTSDPVGYLWSEKKCWQGHIEIHGGNVKWCIHFGKQAGSSSKD